MADLLNVLGDLTAQGDNSPAPDSPASSAGATAGAQAGKDSAQPAGKSSLEKFLTIAQLAGKIAGGVANSTQRRPPIESGSYRPTSLPTQSVEQFMSKGSAPAIIQHDPQQIYIPQIPQSGGADLKLLDLFSKFSGR